MRVFSVGEVYFKIYFVDDGLQYPFIGAYIFLGKNLHDNEVGDTWYFQDCESYARFGSFMNGQRGPREILGLDTAATEDVCDLNGLIDELSRATARRAQAPMKPGDV